MENHLERRSEGCAGDGLWIFGAPFRNVRNADGVRGDPFIGRQIHTAPFCLFNRLGEYILMLIPAAFLSFGIAFFASAMEAERFSQSITRPLQEISSEMVRMDDDYTRSV